MAHPEGLGIREGLEVVLLRKDGLVDEGCVGHLGALIGVGGGGVVRVAALHPVHAHRLPVHLQDAEDDEDDGDDGERGRHGASERRRRGAYGRDTLLPGHKVARSLLLVLTDLDEARDQIGCPWVSECW